MLHRFNRNTRTQRRRCRSQLPPVSYTHLSLTDAGITVLEYSELDTVEIDDIITLAFDIPNKAKAVVSVGLSLIHI